MTERILQFQSSVQDLYDRFQSSLVVDLHKLVLEDLGIDMMGADRFDDYQELYEETIFLLFEKSKIKLKNRNRYDKLILYEFIRNAACFTEEN